MGGAQSWSALAWCTVCGCSWSGRAICPAAFDTRTGVGEHLIGIGLPAVIGIVRGRSRLLLACGIGFLSEALFNDLNGRAKR